MNFQLSKLQPPKSAGIALTLGLLVAGAVSAQDDGGWRRFGESRPAEDPAPQEQEARIQEGRMPVAPVPGSLTLPAGTLITVRLSEPLSSDHNQGGDAFTATLDQPIVVDGRIVARRGQLAMGVVSAAEKAGRIKGVSKLGLELGQLTLVDGQQIPVRTQLAQRRGTTSQGRDAAAVGVTTGVGAAIGAAVDGGFGAGMGAIGGAVVGLAGVLLTRGQPTVIYPETMLAFQLQTPVTINTRNEEAFAPVSAQDFAQNNGRYAPRLRARSPYPGGAYPPPAYYAPYPYYSFGYSSFGYSPFGYYPFGPSFYFFGGGRGGFHHGRR